jgi:uncharacterized protein
MDPVLDSLIRLQTLESDIAAAAKALDDMPARRGQLEARLATQRETVERAGADAARNQVARREVEKDLAAVQSRLSRYKDQLMAVKTNKEYTAMLHEIAAAEKEVHRLEDLLIGLMLEADEIAARAENAQRELAEQRATTETALRDLGHEAARLEEVIARKGHDREALASAIPAAPLSLFQTIKSRRQIAVAEARDGHCSVCQVRIRPQVFNDIRRNEQIIQCDSCQRILYFAPQAAAPDQPDSPRTSPPPAP